MYTILFKYIKLNFEVAFTNMFEKYLKDNSFDRHAQVIPVYRLAMSIRMSVCLTKFWLKVLIKQNFSNENGYKL